jgi:hypothetical protein
VEDLAEQAILQLQAQKLVKTSGSFSQATRRQFITTLGAIAIPLVVSLPIAEQRAYAKQAHIGPFTPYTPFLTHRRVMYGAIEAFRNRRPWNQFSRSESCREGPGHSCCTSRTRARTFRIGDDTPTFESYPSLVKFQRVASTIVLPRKRRLSVSSLSTRRQLKSLHANSKQLFSALVHSWNWYDDLTFVSGRHPVVP